MQCVSVWLQKVSVDKLLTNCQGYHMLRGHLKGPLIQSESALIKVKGNEIHAISYVINASVFLLYVFRLVIRINRKVILR